MRIIWFFILFGAGILGNTAFAAETNDVRDIGGNATPVSTTSTAVSSGTIVSAYAGSGYTFGTGSIWSSTSNSALAPDANGSLSFIFPTDSSRYLYLRNFGFNIPCNAIIESVTVRVTRRNRSTVDVQDSEVALFNPLDLSPSATNMADPSVWDESGAWETVTYTDLTWGETLTPELINNNRFGVLIQAR